MPAHPTPSKALSPRREAPKLRASCDGCGTAKVKCNRGQPECGRCVALGLTCVYRLSRQFGKPPRKRLAVDLDAATTLSYKKRPAWTVQSRENRSAMGFGQSQSVNEPAQLTDILPLPSGINSMSNIESRNNHATMGFGQPQSASEPAQLNFLDPVTDTTLPLASGINSTLSFYEQTQLVSPFLTSLSLDEWPQFDSFGPDIEISSAIKNSALESRLSASALEPVSTMRTSSESNEPHSCPRGSYEIFRDLICPSPSLHAPEANSDTVSAQFDQVLHFNRNAIERLSQLLKCPCAKSGHRAMVHASIVSRILIWYQQAAEWTDSSSWGARPTALTASPTSCSVSSLSPPSSGAAAGTGRTSPLTLTQSTGFAVADVPVSMGTFNIEDPNVQAAFRNQLVLSELKKIANLIDLFVSQDSGESSANGVTSLYSHLGAWLRGEHSRIVRILRARLSALNENLDS